ncbi:receptor-like protein 4 [Salvia splendens]|uniref:receptor-like protein 4 n=1 Tax=Salvia splendens TaxID=180675 RepID=UPI001C259C04|nr:receptor-like protein 4 [Salvia splendens]
MAAVADALTTYAHHCDSNFNIAEINVNSLNSGILESTPTPPTPSTPPGSPTAFYSGGTTSVVSEPLHFRHLQEKTLRFFPLSSGKKNCYSIPTPSPARFYLRTFTVYDNFAGSSHSPSFDVSVEGTLVFSFRSPWPLSVSRSGAYSDLFFHHSDSTADLCFCSVATDSPLVSSIELTRIDDNAYPFNYDRNSSNYILINYDRFSSGSDQWGPGFTNDSDVFGRSWLSESEFMLKSIDVSVTRAGQRVFDVLVNGETVKRVDVYKEVGGFAAYDFSFVVRNLSATALTVRLEPVAGAPVICGLENYAIVPVDLRTAPDQGKIKIIGGSLNNN